MFTDALSALARHLYHQAGEEFGFLKNPIQEKLQTLTGDEATLMELLYGSLPLQDVAGASFETLLSCVRHGLYLRKTYDHVKTLPEDLFLHYVLYPRVGTENLEDCRTFFYDRCKDLLNLPRDQWILAVNGWCAQNMTYQQADDRTESPLTAYRSGYGRCGEESVFAVTALRSLGIPARQVYAPWWSHCDDNHAWVEAWDGRNWRFFGACEIDPVLDKGWFVSAASRAMLVHSRTYFPFGQTEEAFIGTDGPCYLYNQTHRYAETGTLDLCLLDQQGIPCPGKTLEIQVINMAAPRTIAHLQTDGSGRAKVDLGAGTVLVSYYDPCFQAQAPVTLTAHKTTHLTLTTEPFPRETHQTVEFFAPQPTPRPTTPLTPQQLQQNRQAIQRAEEMRKARIQSYFREEYAMYPQEFQEILRLAAGNAPVLVEFYEDQDPGSRPLALEFLKTLSKKDYKDITAPLLTHFFTQTKRLVVEKNLPFQKDLVSPRISCEVLEPWPDDFQPRPMVHKALEPWMDNLPCLRISNSPRFHPDIPVTPRATALLGHTNLQGSDLYLVALSRCRGTPKHLESPVIPIRVLKNSRDPRRGLPWATLQFLPQRDVSWTSGVNFTLERFQPETARYLPINPGPPDLQELLAIREGTYRLTTTNRLPNGNQLVRIRTFSVGSRETLEIPLEPEPATLEQMQANYPLPPISLRDETGASLSLAGQHLLFWLDPGTEPTEHILNELLEAEHQLKAQTLPIVLILPQGQSPRHPTLQQVLKTIPQANLAYGDFSHTDPLARATYLEPGLYPLTILAQNQVARFATAGYAVGTVPMALNLAGRR